MFCGGIAFFDSGVGGLSVLRACEKYACGRPIYYYGDNDRAPYGNLSIKCIRAYAHEAFQMFQRLNVSVAVVACNTVTALLIEELRARYPFPIIGIEPSLLPALKKHRRALVLATNATARSERFQALLSRSLAQNPGATVLVAGCSQLAGEIERMTKGEPVQIERLLPKENVDAVVLGCTHYSLIAERIASFYGAEVFDGNQGVAARLSAILKEGKLLSKADEKYRSERGFFSKLSSVTFLKRKISRKKRLKLSKKHRSQIKVKNVQTLYFLGSGRLLNREFYERMFAFDNMRGKSG